MSLDVDSQNDQDRQWSRHAARYDDLFLDPFRPNVENPIPRRFGGDPRRQVEVRSSTSAAGPGPLLPLLVGSDSARSSRSTSRPG